MINHIGSLVLFNANTTWRCCLVIDSWLWDQGVPDSSPGCARSTLSPWERLFTLSPPTHMLNEYPTIAGMLESDASFVMTAPL